MTTHTLESLYTFAVWMLGDREAAFEAVCAASERAPGDLDGQFVHLAAELVGVEKPKMDHLGQLDDILRLDTTVPVDLDHPLVQGDARRLGVLLNELQRTCLMTTLRALPATRRAAFVLRHVLGLSLDACAAILGSSEAAVRVSEARARRALETYLFPRCEHLHRLNPCHCAARLGGALEKSFIAWPVHGEFFGSTAHGPYPSVEALYAKLPRVHLPIFCASHVRPIS